MSLKPKAIYYSMLRYQPESLALLHERFDVIELPDPSHDTPELLGRAEVLFAPLGYMVDKEKIDMAPNLKCVASNTTGHPHIDVACCRERGIQVACLKFEQDFLRTITPTAELTFGIIIALTRNLIPAHKAALSGNWDRRPFGTPKMLSRMKLGIVGLGRLGSWVAQYGQAFRMAVRYYDPLVDTTDYERAIRLEDLAEWADILTLHVPHEPETEGLIDKYIIQCMRRDSYLINTSRGELVDWRALLDALRSGRIAGVGLDVFEDEFESGFSKNFGKHEFLAFARKSDNVILTPHIGGSTVDAWRETELQTIYSALRAFEPQSTAKQPLV